MKLKKKDVAKLFAVAAAIGAGAAATAVAVNRRNKRKAAEELKRLPKGRNIYFLGNSLSALFGAAYLIKDFGFRGDSIHIYGKYAVDGCGSDESGFVCTDMAFIASENSQCLFDVLKDVPSHELEDISVKTEIENYNNAYPLSSAGRLFGIEGGDVSRNDKKQLAQLLRTLPDPSVTLGDIFGADFFDSDFYAMWQSLFLLERDSSAAEFAKQLGEMLFAADNVETCEGVYDTSFNRYECIYLPLYEYLKGCGVEFCEDIEVTDIDFDEENENVTSFHIVDRETRKTFFLNGGDMCIMTPCTVYEAMTEGSFDAPAPAYGGERFPLWRKLYEKRGGIGRPDELSEEPVILFTATFKNDLLTSRLFDVTMNSPGTLLTLTDSKWRMSVSVPMDKYFSAQKDGTYILTGRILNCGTEGSCVKKAAMHASGAEVLYELVCLLGLEDEWDEIREGVVNVIPVLLPYGGAAVSAGNQKALSPMHAAGNLACIGEFAQCGKAKGDMEYYAASAKEAVYGMFGKTADRGKQKKPVFAGFRIGKRV
ncbi:MAG TPA: oleate hydratase [Candidatus Ornithomonoglobus intestinigallinarum]|uniref:Oleate hydratase n=1 Tax=Candidatus Ornithomonoglobus intestinigallinarum TaxID=2840894 RepID=A0A9D1KP02_9FIRM|nr:oleate hydratase [Candidatus Ornithomonoglobus intestinigallinarum]